MNYLVLELHKQKPWYSNKIVGFKPLPLMNAWMHGANTIVDPQVKTRLEGHSWESNKKIHKQKSYPNLPS